MNLTIYLAVANFISHFLNYFISRLYIRVVHLNLCTNEYFKSANLSHLFLHIKNAASNVAVKRQVESSSYSPDCLHSEIWKA